MQAAEATATLSDLVDAAGGPLAPAQAMAVLAAIEKTLWERVVQSQPHGAVTPDNVLIDPDGSVTLGPEAAGGTAADDAFGFGLLTYVALTGQAPFRRSSPGVVVPITDVAPGFPAFAAEVVMRALGDDEERRPSPRTIMTVLDIQPLESWPSGEVAPVAVPEVTVAEQVEDEPEPAAEVEPELEVEADVEPEPDPDVEPEVEAAVEAETETDVEHEPAAADDEVEDDHPRLLHGRLLEHHDEDDTGHRALGSLSERRAFHHAIREVINPGHEIPEIADFSGDADELPRPTHHPDAPNRPEEPDYRRRMKTVYTRATDDNRRSTMLLVGAILLVILLGTAYALTRDNGDDGGADARSVAASGVPSPAEAPATE